MRGEQVAYECRIGSASDFVSTAVRGYERPDETDFDDANWLVCQISVRVGPFAGAFQATLQTFDFIRFARDVEQLDRAVVGSAAFKCAEEWVDLELSADKNGRVHVAGRVRADTGTRVRVSFEYDTDQTFMRQLLHDLRLICTAFPERGRRK